MAGVVQAETLCVHRPQLGEDLCIWGTDEGHGEGDGG